MAALFHLLLPENLDTQNLVQIFGRTCSAVIPKLELIAASITGW